jgi:hypothetical protein
MLIRFVISFFVLVFVFSAGAAAYAASSDGSAGNRLPVTEVQKSDSAGHSGAVSILDTQESFGMMPWILGVMAAAALGGGALITGRKKRGSGYRIIEETHGD